MHGTIPHPPSPHLTLSLGVVLYEVHLYQSCSSMCSTPVIWLDLLPLCMCVLMTKSELIIYINDNILQNTTQM
jgi:hypothetical protein